MGTKRTRWFGFGLSDNRSVDEIVSDRLRPYAQALDQLEKSHNRLLSRVFELEARLQVNVYEINKRIEAVEPSPDPSEGQMVDALQHSPTSTPHRISKIVRVHEIGTF